MVLTSPGTGSQLQPDSLGCFTYEGSLLGDEYPIYINKVVFTRSLLKQFCLMAGWTVPDPGLAQQPSAWLHGVGGGRHPARPDRPGPQHPAHRHVLPLRLQGRVGGAGQQDRGLAAGHRAHCHLRPSSSLITICYLVQRILTKHYRAPRRHKTPPMCSEAAGLV